MKTLKDVISTIIKPGRCKIINLTDEIKLCKTARTRVCDECGFTESDCKKSKCPECKAKLRGIIELPAELIGLRTITMRPRGLYNSYKELLENHLEKTGFTPEYELDDTYQKPVEGFPNKFYKIYCGNNPELQGQEYLGVFGGHLAGGNYNTETYYINANREIVDDFVTQQIKEEFFPNKGQVVPCRKQAEHGASKPFDYKNIKVENILYFQKGQAVYNVLPKDIMELFNLIYV